MNSKDLLNEWLKSGNKIKKIPKHKTSIKKTPKQRKKKKLTRKLKLREYSNKLNSEIPQSEKWFRSLYESHKLKLNKDLYNKPFKQKYIPDILNYQFKYVIEIDGSIHETNEQKQIDIKKDNFYTKCCFKVFRIIAYDINSYIEAINQLITYRNTPQTIEYKNFLLDKNTINK